VSAPSCSGRKWRCRVANFCQSVKRCGLGAVIAAAYQLTYDYDAGVGLDTKRCGRITAPQH
jgi:hypothetical protein